MPRYYFDIHDCGDELPDDEGVDCPDLAAARVEALKTLGDVAKFDLPGTEFCDFAITIRDESGDALLRLCLTVQDGDRLRQDKRRIWTKHEHHQQGPEQ